MKGLSMYDRDKYGFKREDGPYALVKCPLCGLENYAGNVLSGVCTWCGYDINTEYNTDTKSYEKENDRATECTNNRRTD